MWIIYSLLAAFFAGLTSVFAKIGVKDIDTNLATAIRTTIILIFSLFVVFFINSFKEINSLDIKTLIYLILSGITTALLWLSYFKALQLGEVNKVTPIDKTSIVLTLILSGIFLNESITLIKVLAMILILLGTFIMTYQKDNKNSNKKWIIFSIYTSIFASLATILGKIGLNNIESNLGNMIRTIIVFFIVWIVVIKKKKHKDIKTIDKKSWLSIIFSGIATGLSWLFYFKALKLGEASIVFSLEKLSIVITIIFSWLLLKEKLNKKSIIGLLIILLGTTLLIIKNII